MEYRVLVVDGEPAALGGLERLLRLSGFELVPVDNEEQALGGGDSQPGADPVVREVSEPPANRMFRRRTDVPPHSLAPSTLARDESIRVLVVDDDVDAREVLGKLLRMEGVVVDFAGDGAEALGMVARCAPDAVISDLSMPTMGGLELCEYLRELHPDIPVVLATAFGDMESVVLGMRAGAHDFLNKPLQVEAVLASILEAVERRVSRLATERESILAECECEAREASDERPSGVLDAATADRRDAVLVRREQLARVASELRTVNERLVISSLREQEHAEKELRQRAQLDALLGNLSDGVIIADAQKHIRMVNGAARRILGIMSHSLQTVAQFHTLEAKTVEGGTLPAARRPLTRALLGEDFQDQELLIARADGEMRRVLASGTHVKNEADEVELAIVVFRDITELRRLERHREEYTALVSHDLRTPLSSILLLASNLRRGSVAPEQTAALAERIERNAARMTAMVEEILEASRLEASTLELRREPCDLRKLCEGIVTRLDDARARRVVIEADDAPYPALADLPRVDRAITNILTNALKYSPDDTQVRVGITRAQNDIRIGIVDRGVGLAREDLARLFDRYYRAPSGKHLPGIGLGLYITRLMVEAHGGRIDVESAPGKGSTFTVVLPAHPPAPS